MFFTNKVSPGVRMGRERKRKSVNNVHVIVMIIYGYTA